MSRKRLLQLVTCPSTHFPAERNSLSRQHAATCGRPLSGSATWRQRASRAPPPSPPRSEAPAPAHRPHRPRCPWPSPPPRPAPPLRVAALLLLLPPPPWGQSRARSSRPRALPLRRGADRAEAAQGTSPPEEKGTASPYHELKSSEGARLGAIRGTQRNDTLKDTRHSARKLSIQYVLRGYFFFF